MATISYEIEIAAPPEKIWNILWDKSSYSQWTRFFSEGSQYTSDWKVGGMAKKFSIPGRLQSGAALMRNIFSQNFTDIPSWQVNYKPLRNMRNLC